MVCIIEVNSLVIRSIKNIFMSYLFQKPLEIGQVVQFYPITLLQPYLFTDFHVSLSDYRAAAVGGVNRNTHCPLPSTAAGQGFEPQFPRPERGVLPLHHPARIDTMGINPIFLCYNNGMRESKQVEADIEAQITQPLEKISVVKLVDLFIELAYVARASDVHLEPTRTSMNIRFRIDGLLKNPFEKIEVPKALQQEISSRIKVLSGMRTDEHLIPQDGRFRVEIDEFGAVDVRVSIVPTYHGENAILRVLASTQNFELENLGFQDDELKKVKKAIQKPYGMILANGPTGSGKSTTLYTILKRLNKPDVSVITIEDPIEYSLDGTTQIQVNNEVGLTFANGLRSILRQDPNIIMVGEIRDSETASIAVNAALTGHLVLSTIHTNDSATTFPRLIDMGVPPFLVASTLNIAMAQRLVRTICEKCKQKRMLTLTEQKSLRELLPDIGDKASVFYVGKGCSACGGSGYQGRIGIREVLEINEEIRQLIMNRANASQIKEAAVKNGMRTMIKDGIQKALNGVTSIEEVIRLIHE